MSLPGPDDAFTLARHGDVLVVTPSPALRQMDSGLVEGASAVILEPLNGVDGPLVVADLTHLPAFGTSFLAVLLRCWKRISHSGGTLALAGCSPDTLRLLKLTKVETIWPIYDTVPEAVAALIDD